MSHFDDIEPLLWGPLGGFGVVIAILAIIWAFAADCSSMNECEKRGERYIDSRTDYTLCEQDGGTVVKR